MSQKIARDLLVAIKNSVTSKRVYRIDSHCNGRIKVPTLRYLETFHPVARIRLIYFFFPSVCRWPGREYFSNSSTVKIKVKSRELRAHVCVGIYEHLLLAGTRCYVRQIPITLEEVIKLNLQCSVYSRYNLLGCETSINHCHTLLLSPCT